MSNKNQITTNGMQEAKEKTASGERKAERNSEIDLELVEFRERLISAMVSMRRSKLQF